MRGTIRTLLVAGLVTVCGAGWLAAQDGGAVELGAFGRFTSFDDELALKEGFGGGGRLGYFFINNLQLELTGSYTKQDREDRLGDLHHMPVYGRLVYSLPMGDRLALLIGGGGVFNSYTEGADDFGANGLLGFRYALSDIASLRLEGLADYMPSPKVGDTNLNWGIQIGLSAVMGGRAPDADGDGVADDVDACPGTALGETVDARGCALDSDNDGVTNMRDQCPNTPQGAPVDANGCPRDSDRDGVADYQDRCPNTPAGVAVNEAGCPPDADGDGVPNAADRCPNTPQGAPVDANGCARDSDGDGVADYQDRCANTPSGATVDANGCPLDGDGDGVFDGIDQCPSTEAGTRVDATGCPVLFEEAVTTVVLEGVNFETNSADLTAQARTVLDRVAGSLRGNTEVRVEVGGHTDITGTRAYNLQLSQARAESVMAYLVQQGVSADRMEARGFGPDNPIADNGTRAGRALNRRVELRRTDQ
ncbi:MAG: OmpA family protein [Gemmatimonadota bacterium]|nr:OmpA family protein [Gemmatimonadota bacterium]